MEQQEISFCARAYQAQECGECAGGLHSNLAQCYVAACCHILMVVAWAGKNRREKGRYAEEKLEYSVVLGNCATTLDH